jgi:molybdopterin-containing oxidoreductase family membrane subunit
VNETNAPADAGPPPIEADTLATLSRPSARYWLGLSVSIALVVIGGAAWVLALRRGLGVLGLNEPVMWGALITTFVFFIGVSHSGTLISAILYFTRSPLRSAIGRSAEAMTVITILTAGLYPIIHIGRSWMFFFVLPYPSQRQLWPNFRSPLTWDVFAVSSYVLVSALFLFMGMLPDLALLARQVKGWRRPLYRVLSLGFGGTSSEWKLFETAYPIFAAIVIPLAISVHSVVSWDFAMTLMPGWHSAIFAPYFVAGAIFSGIAMAILLLSGLRAGFGLQRYIQPAHFDLLAKILLGMSLVMTLVYATEFYMAFFRGSDTEADIFRWRATGTFAPIFWLVVAFNTVAPLACFWPRVRRSLPALIVIAALVTTGMWFERFLFIVSTLAHNYDPQNWGNYVPTIPELLICLGGFGWFAMLFLLFVKIFPSMSVAETLQVHYASARGEREATHA